MTSSATRTPIGGARRAANRSRVVVAVLGILAWSIAPPAALAQGDAAKLILEPVGQAGAWFDLTMRPGERRSLAVELGNATRSTTGARTYAADVYSIVNGGFGGRLRDQPTSGMTDWVEYSTEVLDLAPGTRVRRSFTIAVPDDAEPGEHITSIVLENDEPVNGTGAVALAQVVRQAVAVVVTVPGPREPALSIGSARHLVVGGRSTVAVDVGNPGNVRLKPTVGFALFDAAGVRISEATVQMDTVYSWTDTSVEIPLAALLLPGTYRVRLTLDDTTQGAHAETRDIPLIVEAAPTVVPGVAPDSMLVGVDQQAPEPDGGSRWAVALGLLATLVVAIGFGVALRRRRHGPLVKG